MEIQMTSSFEVDTAGNALLDALHAKTTAKHDCWMVENNVPVAPGNYPVGMEGFIPVSKYIPIMHDNSDSYSSFDCMLLTRNKDGVSDITTGSLMKWKDGTDYFWYNHDAVSDVIGFMPLPSANMGTHSKNKYAGTWG